MTPRNPRSLAPRGAAGPKIARRSHRGGLGMGRTALMAALLSAATTLAVASPTVFKPVPGSEYREQIDPPVPVSGLALVGVALEGKPNLDAEQLHVYIGKRERGPLQLRLEMTSADGRFRAHALYEGETAGEAWIALPIVPRESDRQARRQLGQHLNELAVAVRPIEKGNTRLDTVYVASWRPQPAPDQTSRLVLHVNSRRAAMSARSPDQKEFAPCKPVRTAAAVRFDVVCEVEIGRVTAERTADKPVQLILQRRDGFDESTQRVQVR